MKPQRGYSSSNKGLVRLHICESALRVMSSVLTESVQNKNFIRKKNEDTKIIKPTWWRGTKFYFFYSEVLCNGKLEESGA